MRWLVLPAASSRSTSSSREVSGSANPSVAARVAAPATGATCWGSKAAWIRARQSGGTPRASACPARWAAAFSGVLRGGAQVASLVEHLRDAQVRHASGLQPAAGLAGDLQGLPVGVQGRIQVAPGLPDLAEVAGRTRHKVILTGCPALSDEPHQAGLGLPHPPPQPFGHRKVPVNMRTQYPVVLSQMGAGLPRERVHQRGVPAPPGDVGADECDRRGHARQAAHPAGRRLLSLVATRLQCTVGVREKPLGFAHAASHQRPDRLGQEQPGPGADQVRGQRRHPPVDRRAFGALQQGVEVELDQPGGPGRVTGGQGMVDRLVSQPASFAPRGRRPVQPGSLPGCSCRRRARSRSANRWW